jgi:predicted transcriptional regulator
MPRCARASGIIGVAMFKERFWQRREAGVQRLDETVGPLERRVLDRLWARPTRASVRDLQSDFPSTAYTTLMTTLDRLYRKGWLARVKEGRAFFYQPRSTREELASELARRAFERVIRNGNVVLKPVLSTLVDAVSEHDAEALDELERLVRERRDLDRRKRGEGAS